MVGTLRLLQDGGATEKVRRLALNMAKADFCGGGFRRGSNGQEEELQAAKNVLCQLCRQEVYDRKPSKTCP
jgi:hypothetical protein